MRAWQFTGVGAPLRQVETDEPVPGPDDIVIDTGAVGLCHSDIGFMDGTITELLGEVPIVLGHEIVGTVSAVGARVRDFAAGDRVGIPATTDGPGTAMNGGYAEKVKVPAHLPVRLPDGLSFEDAAPATCSGRTAYRAVHTAGRIESGMNVGIIGFGGLGYFGLQIAKAAGATVFVAELHEARWPLAYDLGAEACAQDIRDFESAGLDLIIDFAGASGTLDSAIGAVRQGGRIVEVGLGAETGSVSIPNITMKEVTIVGSSNGTKNEASAILQLVAEGSVRPRVERITFEAIPTGLQRLERGGTDGRLVVVF
ncbi:alcohol dehydrogenase catalytic domain-containing protein [Rhodococcus sp. T2V]|uniref:alcohol dehydrogenase catalytic domain-containing protein n=1 Tax=Rhodococcus sp. T2V TaxID=3034164 RepID=UPI0023E2E4B7|nr:zinc-binding dehydrogenase [Rhodococcus sp. T2V]MDF3303755.1 zinc-binding dehydrogenase [Rhodococcus sp. T2V]